MDKETVSFRIERHQRQALDALASLMDRNRSYIIKEAIDAYLEIQQWQLAHIEEGIAQADSDRFASAKQVEQAIGRWHRSK